MIEMCRDDRARREWLWLRAHEKDDEVSIESLERADPDLRGRMDPYAQTARAIPDARAQREAYGRMLDERMPDVDLIACDCPECARLQAAE